MNAADADRLFTAARAVLARDADAPPPLRAALAELRTAVGMCSTAAAAADADASEGPPGEWRWGADVVDGARSDVERAVAAFCVEHLQDSDCDRAERADGADFKIEVTCKLVPCGDGR